MKVRVEKSNAIMLHGMEGSTLGVWVAHGEGRCFFTRIVKEAMRQNCVALKYVDDGNVNPFQHFNSKPETTNPCHY